ncbi:MAG: rhomboid family intramembrane serine protease [Planctomycetes bacterium]|nr:rhomboid family intramembrane serine protease [Planctomycetota bacterium]
MAYRTEWEEPDEPGRGSDWRAALAATPVASALLVGAIAVTLLEVIVAAAGLPAIAQPSRWLGLRLSNAPFVVPFFSYVLPHAPRELMHLVLNMFVLWFLGRELESRLGRGPFMTLFFGSALVGAVAHLVVSAQQGDDRPLIGASGGLYGLIFFIARETPDRTFLFYFFRIPAKVLALLLVAFSLHPLLFEGFAGGVAHLCHLGGALFGFLWCRHRFDALSWWGTLREQRAQQRAATAARDEAADDAEMDRLLAKIHASGMNSLTERERQFLRARSESLKGGRR